MLAVAVVVLVAATVATAMALGGPAHRHGVHTVSSTTVARALAQPGARALAQPGAPPARWLGRDGIVARWVVDENRRRGTTAWRIPGNVASGVEGFADRTYVRAGDEVRLFVRTAAPFFRVDAYRMGYYGGTGGRLVWRSAALPGAAQPQCVVTPVVNMVSCATWRASLALRVTTAFVPGDYLLKLIGSRGQQSYVPLTVWDPASRAAYFVKNDVYTWQAWNSYGGYDFYQGVGSCPSHVYPVCNRARVVSFDRPYATGAGAGDFLANELPLVSFVEQRGLDVTYANDLLVEQHPTILLSHRALLSLGHDECWSLGERRAAVAAEARGVNMVFFAASAILRHVRLEPSPLGPGRQEVDYRDSAADPANGRGDPLEVTGNTWSQAPASWPESGFVGASYAGFLEPDAPPAPFVVADGHAWIFRGTGLHTGSVIPGVLQSDFDAFESATHPSDLQILGHSPVPLQHTQSGIGRRTGHVFSDMTYYSDPRSGAGVFDSGTNAWIPDIGGCALSTPRCMPQVLQRITGNLLLLFGRGPAGRFQPSTPNWQALASLP